MSVYTIKNEKTMGYHRPGPKSNNTINGGGFLTIRFFLFPKFIG